MTSSVARLHPFRELSGRQRSAWLIPAIAGIVAFAAYGRTLLPGMAFGDWGEMQTVPHVLGVAHPTGYPTYILLAAVGELVPIGSVAFRANLLSAAMVAGAVAITTAILGRLAVRGMFAVAAALAFAAVGTVWAAATVAEVNPLHLLLIASLLHRSLLWQQKRMPRDLVLTGLLLGLAAGNHLLTLLVAPWLILYVLWTGRRGLRSQPALLLATTGAGLLGLSVYAYVPVAAGLVPPLAYNHPVTAESVWWLASGAQFRGQFDFLSATGLDDLRRSLPALWSVLSSRGTAVLPILGVLGLASQVRTRPAFGLACLAILGTSVYAWASYLRLEHYLLVPWLVLAVGSGIALEAIGRTIEAGGRWILARLGRVGGIRGASLLVGAVPLAAALALGVRNWGAADRSADRSAEIYVEAMLAALPPNAAILSEWDASTPLWYAKFVLGRRPDVLVVDDTDVIYEGWGSRERRIASLICVRPVFVLRLNGTDLAPIRALYHLEPFIEVRIASGGPVAVVAREVYRVEPRPETPC